MIYVGIDVAKSKHDICALDSQGTILITHPRISNSLEGFTKLHSQLQNLLDTTEKKSVKIAFEDTGHYCMNLFGFLNNKNYTVIKYNTYLIKEFSKSQSLRRTKTDKVDAKIIALKLITDLNPERSQPNADMEELKILTRHRFRFGRRLAEFRTQYTRILDIIFPELTSVVSDKHSKYVLEILKKYPSASQISSAHLKSLTAIIYNSSKHRHGKDKANNIRNLAAKSIGSNSAAFELELKQVIKMIEILEEQLAVVDKEIKSLMDKIEPILSIPGISYGLGSVILAEIRNIDNFKTPAQLLAFEDMEPSIYQSGQYEGSGGMVKRGSTYLRWAMYVAARSICLSSPTFNTYLEKKRKEGKHYKVALSHIAKKLTRIIFYILKTGNRFDENALL